MMTVRCVLPTMLIALLAMDAGARDVGIANGLCAGIFVPNDPYITKPDASTPGTCDDIACVLQHPTLKCPDAPITTYGPAGPYTNTTYGSCLDKIKNATTFTSKCGGVFEYQEPTIVSLYDYM